MTNGHGRKLIDAFPKRNILISHWSDKEECHQLFRVNLDGSRTKVGEFDSMDQVIYHAQDEYGCNVVLVFDEI